MVKNEFTDNVLTCELINDDFTVKIFQNKKFEYYATVIYEDDTIAKMLVKTKVYKTMEQAKNEAIDYIDKYIKKNK